MDKLRQRQFLLFMVTFLLPPTLHAQVIPNGGFENWTNGNPDNWRTNNAPSVYLPITQSSTAYSGSYSAMGTIITQVLISC
jgi:hypothetical protein